MSDVSRRALLSLVLALAAVPTVALTAGPGCLFDRRGLSRDGLLRALQPSDPGAGQPSLDELLALRMPAPAGAPPPPLVGGSAVARARDAAARGDMDTARAAWAAATDADTTEALLQRCLFENVLRRSELVLEACPAFLARAPADPRAIAALRILLRTKFSLRAASDIVVSEGPAWVAACARAALVRGSCADLAFLVAEERIARARARPAGQSDQALASAVADSGRLRTGTIEGPFDGELHSIFAAQARGDELSVRPSPGRASQGAAHARSMEEGDQDGALALALYGVEGVYRLRSFVFGAGSATIYLTGGRAARVRIDGVVVAERSLDAASPSIIRGGVVLSGTHHEVEVLALAGGRDVLTVALLDRMGRPLAASANDSLDKESPMAAAARPDGALEALAAGDVSLEGLLLRQIIARPPSFGGDVDENQQLARVLVSRFGWSPHALAVAAEAVADDPALPDRVSSSMAARLWREVRKSWPLHPVALISEARELREERPDQALTAYRALVKQQPRYSFGHRDLIELALEADLVDEALVSANALLELDRSRENIDAALPAVVAAGQAARAGGLLQERALLGDERAGATRARRLLEQGRTTEGIEVLTQAASHGDPFVRDELVALLAVDDAAAAQRVIDDALAHRPADPRLLLLNAQLAAAREGEQAGKERLLEALPLLRRDERAVRWAEDLGVAPPWLSRLALGDEVIRARRALALEPFAGHGAVALLDDLERVIEDDEGSIVVRHMIVELRSKEALDQFGELALEGERLVRLRVSKPDGQVIEPERHRGIDDVSLPQLALGDIIEKLTVRSEAAVALGGAFERRSLDGMALPALSRRYIVSWPEGWDTRRRAVLVALHGMAPPRQEIVVDAAGRRRVVHTFALDNVASAPPEPFAAEREETARSAGYAWGIDDAFWARRRGTGIARAAQRDAWLDECARRIAGSGEQEEQLRRIFAFVVRRIEPASSPDGANAVLAGGKGQRTPLFLALLRAVGLNAEAVALQLPAQPNPSTLDGDSWSLIAVRVKVGAAQHYAIVDGNAVLDQLPAMAQGASVLELSLISATTPGAQLVSQLPDEVVDRTPLRVQIDVTLIDAGDPARPEAGSLSGLVVITVPPGKADAGRRGARRATQEQLRTIVEGSLASSLPGVRVIEVKTPDLEAFGTALHLGAHIEVPVPQLVDGTARFEHLFANGASGGLQLAVPFSAYLAVADRSRPALVVAEAELLEVQVTLPATAAFVEAPATLSAKAGPFVFEQQVQISDGQLYWRREMSKQTARISPAEWGEVRTGLAALVARSDARLSFALSELRRPAGGITTDSQEQAAATQNR